MNKFKKSVNRLIELVKADKENRIVILPRVIEKPCLDCGYYGWDMPQCGDCYQNGEWIYFNDRYRDIDDE